MCKIPTRLAGYKTFTVTLNKLPIASSRMSYGDAKEHLHYILKGYQEAHSDITKEDDGRYCVIDFPPAGLPTYRVYAIEGDEKLNSY